MLKIVRTPFGSTAHAGMCEKIRRLTEEKKRSLLIVPEQETVLAEGELSEILPDYSPLYFEATNFTRLANSTFRALGGICGEYCDAGRRALIMWRTLTELSPVLAMTANKREINAGLVERALGAIKEIEGAGIGYTQLAEALADEGVKADRRLSDKLGDLTRIHALYKQLLTERYADSAEDIDGMIKRLGKNEDFLSDREVFIEGFTSFTEPQYRLIAMLAQRTRVSVYLVVSKLHREEFPYTELREAEERLISAARRAGAEIKIETEAAKRLKKSEAISKIAELLFSKSADIDNITLQNNEEIRIFEASMPFEECSFVASDIKRRVIEGASYSDFAIITRELTAYLGILDTALAAEGIPAFISRKRDISSFELIKLIYTAYSAILGGYSREDVITYAKCGLTGLTHEECDEFECYVNTWSLGGSRFTDGVIWNMNPTGYSSRRSERTDEKLLRINATREKLIEPLIDFAERVRDAKTAKDHAQALYAHLTRLGVAETLSERSLALYSLGEKEFAEESSRLWGLVCDSLDALVEVSGDCPTDAEGFLSQLKILFANSDIARIPGTRDSVTVGSADMIRLRERKHVYLIGAISGKFPATVSESSYFSEQDKLRLSHLGLSIAPELETKSARELYIFLRALSYASESVTILYSARDTRQKACEPSEPIARISALTGEKVRPVKISSLGPEDKIYSPVSALLLTKEELRGHYEAVRAALIENGYENAVRVSEGSITNADMKLGEALCRELYDSPLALTQSRIDSFVGCPLAYFCKFTVGLREEDSAEFDASEVGTFVHAILENFFRTLIKDGRSAAELDEEEKLFLTRRAAEKYLAELGEELGSSSARTKIKLEHLCRAAQPVVDGLCEEFSTSLFEPRFFELSINRKDPDSPEPITFTPEGEREIFVYGIIDRVDTYKSGDDVYVRVVDYKTGHKSFSPDDMAEGKNLQMFLYLKAILESEKQSFKDALGITGDGRARPAGVIYVKTSVKDVRVDTPSDEEALAAFKSAQEREGMILNDAQIISAMGIRNTPLSTPKKPDEIAPTRRKYLFDEQDFDNIMGTVEESVLRVAKGIRSGDASANPKADARGIVRCDYCEFKPICRMAKVKK